MSNSGYLPPVRQWWIGRSAGDAKQMRLRRLNFNIELATGRVRPQADKGLLDPPILRCLKPQLLPDEVKIAADLSARSNVIFF